MGGGADTEKLLKGSGFAQAGNESVAPFREPMGTLLRPPVGNTVVISGGGKDKRRSTDLGSLRIWRDVVEFRALT